MDTKWKNRKRIISFLVFFLGVSLTLGSAADIFRKKPSGVHVWDLDRLQEDDYQTTARFREYMSGRLEDFLIMATGGEGLWGLWGYDDGTYYGSESVLWYSDFLSEAFSKEADFAVKDSENSPSMSAQEVTDYLGMLEEMQTGYLELLDVMEETEDAKSREALRSELEMYQNEMRDMIENMKDNLPGWLSAEQIKPLTDEQKQKIAEKYHDSIKGDKNLLYAIAYDGETLYSNSDLIAADGSMPAPEGYNFILHFDGEKVRIQKDGEEVDIYGDGYYRDDGDWYVPGYSNFQTEDTLKKADVCMAVAKDPVFYMEGSYQKGSAMQYDNGLYWMNDIHRTWQQSIRQSFIGLTAGLVLLLAAFFLRKSSRQAKEAIARFQARIWLECKILLFLAHAYGVYMLTLFSVMDDYGYNLWEEMFYAYDYNFSYHAAVRFTREMLSGIPAFFWLMLFWGLWLVWNDLRHNKKIWRSSLTAKLCATYSAKNLSQPLSRKMTRRNRTVFLTALVYALLMLEEIALIDTVWGVDNVRVIVLLLAALETFLFLALLYVVGTKNIKAAREVEALSRRITEIRNGDYAEGYGKGKGTGSRSGTEGVPGQTEEGDEAERETGSAENGLVCDLESVMVQLEDIRHGMARAVDEQMKSERMKVELIANVSHDIKTPLTSIISYVEILKQEEGLPDYVKDYVRILDEKSQRLKNMIADVFVVSKAASGELPMEMEELDFGKLLRQTLADMEGQIDNSDVTFRTDLPEAPVMIRADGQRMYRVFQNLFQNAIKYSLQGSRVYVTLRTDGCLAEASVKNTSGQELEKGKDFAERFARGDASRTDGGSGLGLSIARSFTEACGGEFSWETDADLFAVKVVFRAIQTAES